MLFKCGQEGSLYGIRAHMSLAVFYRGTLLYKKNFQQNFPVVKVDIYNITMLVLFLDVIGGSSFLTEGHFLIHSQLFQTSVYSAMGFEIAVFQNFCAN